MDLKVFSPPKVGIITTAAMCNRLKIAAAAYPEMEDTVLAVITHLYDQSDWIEKMRRTLKTALHESDK